MEMTSRNTVNNLKEKYEYKPINSQYNPRDY